MAVNPSIQLGTSGNWAIKEDNLLAYKQLGNKFFDREFDFSRGTTATFVGRNGLIQESGLTSAELVTNGDFSQEGPELVTNGDFATDSDWSKGANWTISGGTANSDGVNATSNFSQVVTSFSGKTFLVEGSASNVSQGFAYISLGGTDLQIVVNSNGSFKHYVTISSGNSTLFISARNNFIGSIDNVSVKEVGQDWILGSGWSIGNNKAVYDGSSFSSLVQVIPNLIGKTLKLQFDIVDYTSGTIRIFPDTKESGSDIRYSNNGTYVEYYTAAQNQLNFQTQRLNGSITNISVKEVQLDVPRIDFTDDPTGHLLLEPQSTNILAYSQDFSQNYWGKQSATVTTSTITDPTGDQNSFKLVPNSGTGGNRSISNNFVGLSGLHTQSVFAKKGEYNYIALRTRNNPNVSVMFDLENGTFNVNQTSVAFVSAKIEDYGSGWYKCSITVDPSQMSSAGQIFTSFSVGITGNETNSFDGDGTSGVYIFGAQFEQKSYATSYIPTSGSAVTRNQELCNNSGTVNDFNSEEGVLYAEIAALANDGTWRVLGFSDGTTNNRVFIGYSSFNDIACRFEISPSVVYNFNFTADITINSKLALKYKENDFALWVNGVEVNSQSSGNTFPIGTLTQMQFTSATSSSPFYGKTKNLKVFKRALTDAELYLLTVTQYQSYQEMATALNYTL